MFLSQKISSHMQQPQSDEIDRNEMMMMRQEIESLKSQIQAQNQSHKAEIHSLQTLIQEQATRIKALECKMQSTDHNLHMLWSAFKVACRNLVPLKDHVNRLRQVQADISKHSPVESSRVSFSISW